MKKVLFFVLIHVLVSINLFSQDYYLYVSVSNENVKPKFKGNWMSNDDALNQIFFRHGVISYHQSFPGAKNINLQKFYEIHLSGNIDSLENKLKEKNIFEEIYRCDYYKTGACTNSVTINDPFPLPTNKNALDLLNAQCAWTITKGDPNIVVGVIDTEFETTHEDLVNTFIGVVGSQTYPQNHGTAVSSCVATGTNNNKGIAGIGYNTRIKGYHADSETLWNNIWQAYQDGIKIINVSWIGIGSYPNLLAVQEMTTNGVVLVVAAGNFPNEIYHSTYADIPGVINVSGVDSNNYHETTGHAHNQWVDVCALSYYVAVCKPGNTYGTSSGTSFAAPQVAGVAALIRSVNSNLSPADIENIIKSTTDPIADAYLFPGLLGTGRVNAYKAVLDALCYDNSPMVNETITQNTTWNTTRHITGTITIQNGVTLTITSTTRCANNAQIIVHPNGKLVVDGGMLTSACSDKMWQGIVVMGYKNQPQLPQHQGMVELKNEAVIEHAICAISVADDNIVNFKFSGGGIVKADSAIFRNNLKAIEYLPYENHDSTGKIIDNVGKFTNCTFVIDNDNRFTNNGTPSWNHVTLWGVRDVTFEGCVFQDKTGLYSTRLPVPTTRGIYTIDASVKVINHCRKGGYTGIDCPCHESYTEPSKFINLTNGIQSYNTGSSYRLFSDQSLFNYCSTGVDVSTQNDDRITRCSFENNNTGLHTFNSSGYTIQENTFTSRYPATGISINNSGSAENRVYNNDFNNIEKGIFVQGTNYSSSNIQGLQFLNNKFTGGDYDIYLSQNTTVRPNQGTSRVGADNKFTGTTTSSIFSQGPKLQLITYYHTSGSNSVYSPENPTGNITVVPNVLYGSTVSYLCDDSPFKSEIITDSIEQYKAMQQQYDKLFAQLKDNPELLDEILILSYAMRELSNHAISRILDNNVLSLDELKQWYEVVRTPIAKYSLAEVYVYERKYDQAEAVLREILTLFTFNELELIEHNNYMQFYHFKKQMKLSERNWTQLNETEIAQLQTIAEATRGRSASMAKGVLCFFYDICYEDENSPPLFPSFGGAGVVDGSGVVTPPKFSAMEQNATYELTLFPNPTSSEMTVTLNNTELKIKKIEVLNIYGKSVSLHPVNQFFGTLKMNDLANGIYILKVYLDNKDVVYRRIIKN